MIKNHIYGFCVLFHDYQRPGFSAQWLSYLQVTLLLLEEAKKLQGNAKFWVTYSS